MDKKKTGNLIREARTAKNLTQNELGELLGVTNKAISRWENGESFPDVGILENLSSILDIRIQDIVTGEEGSTDDKAINDALRIAKLQQHEKLKKKNIYIVSALAILTYLVAGYLGLSGATFLSELTPVFIILMVIAYASVLSLPAMREGEVFELNKTARILNAVTVVTFSLTTVSAWAVHLLFFYEKIGIKAVRLGPMMIRIFAVAFVISIVSASAELILFCNGRTGFPAGILFSTATVFAVSFYADSLYRMLSAAASIRMLIINTVIVVTGLCVALLINCLFVKNGKPIRTKTEVTGKRVMRFMPLIAVLGAFVIYNLVWVLFVYVKYTPYEACLSRKGSKTSDGYEYYVKKPDYLSFTGNLVIMKTRDVDGKTVGDGLMIRPKTGDGCEVSFSVTKTTVDPESNRLLTDVSFIPLDENREPDLSTEEVKVYFEKNRELFENNRELIDELYMKAYEMWGIPASGQ